MHMVQERRCIAQSEWRRCFIAMSIYIYICIICIIIYSSIEEIQGTESLKSRTIPNF